MTIFRELKGNSTGDAVVEATILFPIIIMIFAGLVLLSAYIPTRAALQRATQYAATALATQHSDTWLFYDSEDEGAGYFWEKDKNSLANVYSSGFSGIDDAGDRADGIVKLADSRAPRLRGGELGISAYVNDRIIYKEIVVTATHTFTSPVDLSIVGFPREIEITVTSTAVVHDGDEFIRNVDLTVDFLDFISEKFGLSDIGDAIGSFGNRFKSIIG